MVDGSAKYLPDEPAMTAKPARLSVSQFARGSAEAVVAAVQTQLKQLHDNIALSQPK